MSLFSLNTINYISTLFLKGTLIENPITPGFPTVPRSSRLIIMGNRVKSRGGRGGCGGRGVIRLSRGMFVRVGNSREVCHDFLDRSLIIRRLSQFKKKIVAVT